MPFSRKIAVLIAACLVVCCAHAAASAQKRLTYSELNVALVIKIPNKTFKTQAQLISWISIQVQNRKVDKPLTKDREDDLRQAGATEELIEIIRANSPGIGGTTTSNPKVVDLGNLAEKAVNLVKPDYTPEARKAGTFGEVKLALELDEVGRVTSVARLVVLPDGLTERAIEAARQSTFQPARLDGKPARGKGILTYNFKLNTINVAAVMAAADELRNRSDYDRAIPEYTRIVNADSKNSKAFFGRGMCYLMKGDYDTAVVDLDAAGLSDPSDSDALYYLAIAQDYKGDSLAAANNYAKAISLNPELGKRDMTECLYIDKFQMSPEQAKAAANDIISACNKVLRSSPEFLQSLIYAKRGIGFRLKPDYDKAIADFETARRQNPKFMAVQGQLHAAYNGRGLIYFDKKDYKAALGDVSAAIDLKPQSPTPYINRCVIYLYGLKQADLAIDDCTTAIRLSTKSSMAYVHRGYAYEYKGNLAAAIADYKKALDIEPRNQAAQTNLNRLQQPSIRNGKPKS